MLTPNQRANIASKAAKTRWQKDPVAQDKKEPV
jgi:hypothetical protein